MATRNNKTWQEYAKNNPTEKIGGKMGYFIRAKAKGLVDGLEPRDFFSKYPTIKDYMNLTMAIKPKPEANIVLEKVAKLGGNDDYKVKYANTLATMGRYKEAYEVLNKA